MRPQDWERFTELAIRDHRVAPMIAPVLRDLNGPNPVLDRLDTEIRRNAIATLTQIGETRRMVTTLQTIGVEPVVLKSWPLGARLYGDAGRRHTGDLDILVPRDKVWEACNVLAEAGYNPSDNTTKMNRRAKGVGNTQLIQAVKDVELTNPTTGVVLELHWQMLHYHGWPDFLDRPDAVIRQQTQAGPLLVLNDQTNLMFLSTHGSLHLWERLKWLLDIALLAQERGADRLSQDLDAADAIGITRPVMLALNLAGRLFGSPVPQGATEHKAVQLEHWVLKRLGRTERAISGTRHRLGVRRMALGLAQDWRQRLGVVGYDTTRRVRLISLDLARLGRTD